MPSFPEDPTSNNLPEVAKKEGVFAIYKLSKIAPDWDLENSEFFPIYTHRGHTRVRYGTDSRNYFAMLELLLDRVKRGLIDGNKVNINGWLGKVPPAHLEVARDGWVLFTNREPDPDEIKFFVENFGFDVHQ